ncbi:MAG: YraN family protein [Candidatus Dormibacteria bacterium]
MAKAWNARSIHANVVVVDSVPPLQRLGRQGEELARAVLEERGYRVLDADVRLRLGQIDLVALDGGELVFVEVKSRTSERFGPPQLAVGPRKRRKLIQLAQEYLGGRAERLAWRIDVVALRLSPAGELRSAEVLRDVTGW